MRDSFAETKEEMREGFARLEARMDKMEASTERKFGELDQRFDRLQQTLVGGAIAVVVAIVGSNAF